jgi:protocatechuate 3,4-dioxygenase, alpha subunit
MTAVQLPDTPGQTVGPFFHDALPFRGGPDLIAPSRPDSVRLWGDVLDGDGTAVPDALVEIWQASAGGRVPCRTGSFHRDDSTFTGWGRCPTDTAGRYCFTTVKPGMIDAGRAPFIAIVVFARGLLNRLFTRAYFPDAPELGSDPFLGSIPEERRSTLVAVPDDGFRFDIVLQGTNETVFLEFGEDRPASPAKS